MSGRTFIPLEKAGPLRLPAAIVHPDDPLPKTWRVVSTWTYRRQQGAYVVRDLEALSGFRKARDSQFGQIVYRRSAPRRRTSHVGHAIACAVADFICTDRPNDYDRPASARRRDYYRAQGIDVRQLDARAASGPSAAPKIISDDLMELDLSARWYNVLYRNGIKSVSQLVQLTADELSGCRNIGGRSITELQERLAERELALARTPTPTPIATLTAAVQQSTARLRKATAALEALPPLAGPPEPGLERARWLGERVTVLTGRVSHDRLPHTRRREAARIVLLTLDGYGPSDAKRDALYYTSAAVELAGLNAYARRVLDEGERSRHEGDTDAVL